MAYKQTHNLCFLSPKTPTFVKKTSNYDCIGRKEIGIHPGSFQHRRRKNAGGIDVSIPENYRRSESHQ